VRNDEKEEEREVFLLILSSVKHLLVCRQLLLAGVHVLIYLMAGEKRKKIELKSHFVLKGK
jgi:hypothetical protein